MAEQALACRVVGQYRSTQRYRPEPAALELRLVARMNELAAEAGDGACFDRSVTG